MLRNPRKVRAPARTFFFSGERYDGGVAGHALWHQHGVRAWPWPVLVDPTGSVVGSGDWEVVAGAESG